MPPILPQSKKLRTALLAGAAVVFVGVVATILVLSAGSSDKPQTTPRKRTSSTSTTDAKKVALRLVQGRVVVQDTGFPTKLEPPVRRAVMRGTQRYFDDAIQAPLSTGRVNNSYARVFDPGVNGLALRRDRDALTDAATGPIRGPVRVQASRVRIDGLGGQNGKPLLVATTFNMKVNTATPTGKLTIKRHVELTFAYENHRWMVTAYRVTVRRSLGARTTVTTAHSGPRTTT